MLHILINTIITCNAYSVPDTVVSGRLTWVQTLNQSFMWPLKLTISYMQIRDSSFFFKWESFPNILIKGLWWWESLTTTLQMLEIIFFLAFSVPHQWHIQNSTLCALKPLFQASSYLVTYVFTSSKHLNLRIGQEI